MIYIQILDYKWSPLDYDDLEVEEVLAEDFVKQVKKAIHTQKYKFAPLSPKYLEYKRRRGLSLHTWEATSQLKNTLSYKIVGNTIIIGWDKSLKHKGSNTEIYKIATYLEYGTLNTPPRPLFRSVLKEYNTNTNMPTQSDIFSPDVSKTDININTSIKHFKLTKFKNKIKSFFNIFKKR